MKVPTVTLNKMKQSCFDFKSDESGVGVADYGLILALVMLLGGLAAGWYLFSSSSQSGKSGTAPNVQGAPPVRRSHSDSEGYYCEG